MKRLEHHRIVAWDLDGTLYDNDKSDAFVDFILRNPYGQKFCLVTFRSHGLEHDIPDDLNSIGLRIDHFESIHTVPYTVFGNYFLAMRAGSNPEAVDIYRSWKGLTCSQIGATLLIDDMPAEVELGCRLHGIELLHPNELVTA